MPRAPKRCGKRDCTEYVVGRIYCPVHTAEADRRPSTTARGYGWQHQQARTAAMTNLIGTPCTRCGEPVVTGQALDLDHTDDRTGYLGLAHRHCNSVAGGMASGRAKRT